MDADTYVCSSLLEAACAVSEGPVVAFVPVDRGREHAASVLARSERWRVPGHAVEANTGVVAWRNATASRALVDAWLRAYGDLADASGFLMDQPAFRAALHATRARTRRCRRASTAGATTGRAARGAGGPLRCAGYDADEAAHGAVAGAAGGPRAAPSGTRPARGACAIVRPALAAASRARRAAGRVFCACLVLPMQCLPACTRSC